MVDGIATGIDVVHIARLARVDLSEDELRAFRQQLQDIVGYVNKVQELDVSAVEPMSHGVPVNNVFRDDVTVTGLSTEAVLDNAPSHREGQFIVPRIME